MYIRYTRTQPSPIHLNKNAAAATTHRQNKHTTILCVPSRKVESPRYRKRDIAALIYDRPYVLFGLRARICGASSYMYIQQPDGWYAERVIAKACWNGVGCEGTKLCQECAISERTDRVYK